MKLPSVPVPFYTLQAVFLGLGIPLFAVGRAAMAVSLGLSGLILFYRLIQEQGWREWAGTMRSPPGVAAGATIAWWLFGSAFAFDPANALISLSHTVAYLLLAMELVRQFAGRQDMIVPAMRALVMGSIILCLYVVSVAYIDQDALSALEAARGKDLNVIRVFKPFGSILACMLPLAIWWGIRERSHWRWITWSLIPLGALVIYYNGVEINRSAVIGAAAAIIGPLACWIFILMPGWARRNLLALVLVLVAMSGILFLEALPRMPFDGMRLPEIALPFPDLHRQVIWGYLYDLIKANPLIGVGIDCINLLPSSQAQITLNLVEKIETVPVLGSHPHNWVLEILVETGLPGFVGVLVFLILLVRQVLFDRRLGPARWAALGLIFAFWVSSLANFSIWTSWWQVVFTVLCGLVLAVRSKEGKPA